MGQPVVHFEIAAKDAKKLQDFYARVFDWDIDANNEWNYGVVTTGGEGGINGGIGQAVNYQGVMFYVQVDDPQAYLDKVTSLGGQTMMPPSEIPGIGTLALFRDPEGNLTGLFKR